jgi:hypothetical protein
VYPPVLGLADIAEEIPLYEQTLTDRLRVLGADHPSTLTSRNNLAYTYQAAGEVGLAIPLFERTLADCLRMLGGNHPLTKTVRANLEASNKRTRQRRAWSFRTRLPR